MDNRLKTLFQNNRAWAKSIMEQQPEFFEDLSLQQSPKYLWIGCADSRVPANQIIGLPPGEVFVHRNIANVVVHTDLNCLSVIQYAVEVLKVEHIIVTGHYGCGGVAAALAAEESGEVHGLIDNWLRHIRDVYRMHRDELQALPDFKARCHRLCELNVVEQVRNVLGSTIVQQAWGRRQKLHLHGWIYSLEDGLLRDLGI
ncbi:carbonate dehydratase [Candidatus Haliotispira prima]|uniref:Carbonic anhydrase n=1 Tax=Candidatus Haliotispira prima TaxID=3034016 RepID=A0ABY8MFB4_9SPIO|nr:carbonate dehydratase [Candidatus Haliotispira prima]